MLVDGVPSSILTTKKSVSFITSEGVGAGSGSEKVSKSFVEGEKPAIKAH